MSTQIRDSETNELLWQANDFGKYSMEKIEAISKILKEILTDTTLSMETSFNKDSLSMANLYTKDECNDIFVQLNVLEKLVKGLISELMLEGSIPNSTLLDLISLRLETLNISCTGYDYKGDKKQAGFQEQIDAIDGDLANTANNIIRLFKVVFQESTDGIYNFNNVLLAPISETGNVSSLNSGISNRKTLVDAINSVYSAVVDMKSTVQSISQSITSINSKLESLEKRITELENKE